MRYSCLDLLCRPIAYHSREWWITLKVENVWERANAFLQFVIIPFFQYRIKNFPLPVLPLFYDIMILSLRVLMLFYFFSFLFIIFYIFFSILISSYFICFSLDNSTSSNYMVNICKCGMNETCTDNLHWKFISRHRCYLYAAAFDFKLRNGESLL